MEVTSHILSSLVLLSQKKIPLQSLSVSFLQDSNESNLMVEISFVSLADFIISKVVRKFLDSVATLPLSVGAYRRFAVLAKS